MVEHMHASKLHFTGARDFAAVASPHPIVNRGPDSTHITHDGLEMAFGKGQRSGRPST